jgi:signal transduction histidine kinase
MEASRNPQFAISRAQVHDLKNRLTVIKGMTQLLARQARRDDWQRQRMIERVEALEGEVVRMESMLNDLSRPNGRPEYDTKTSAADSRDTSP